MASATLAGPSSPALLVPHRRTSVRRLVAPASGPSLVAGRRRQWQHRRPPAASAAASLGPGSSANDGSAGTAASKPSGPLAAWQHWWRLDDPAAAAAGIAGVPPTPPQSTRDILRKVGALLAPDRLLLCAAICFMLLAAAAELAIPHYVTAAVFSAAKASGPGMGPFAGGEAAAACMRCMLAAHNAGACM